MKKQEFCPLPSMKTLDNMQFFVDTGLKIYNIQLFSLTDKKIVKYFPMLKTWKFSYAADNHTIDDGIPSYNCMMFYLVEEKNHDNRSIAVYNVPDFTIQPIVPNGFFWRTSLTGTLLKITLQWATFLMAVSTSMHLTS